MNKLNLDEFDWENIEVEDAEKQQYYWVGLYYFFGKVALEQFGEKGNAALRKSIREYGQTRGKRMRAIANAKGEPADLVTLFGHYDLMSDPRFVHPQEGLVMTPEVKKSITGRCPDAEMWGRMPNGLEIGSIYCEEVHHQIYQGFDPAIQVNLCETLTNGGTMCRFHLYCRKANQQEYPLPEYIVQKWDDFDGNMVASIHSIFCIMYLKMAKILRDELGEDVVREALEEFCYIRGVRMRKLHEKLGIPISMESFLAKGDLFLDQRFGLTIKKLSDKETEVTTVRDIMYEVSKTYDCVDLKELYDEISYEYLLKGYHENYGCKIIKEEDKEKIHLIFTE